MVRSCGRGGCGWDGVHSWEKIRETVETTVSI